MTTNFGHDSIDAVPHKGRAMLNLHPGRDLVYPVARAIPDPIHPGRTLAEPGDLVLVRAYHEKFPITVMRHLPIEAAAFFPAGSVTEPFAYEPDGVAPASDQRVAPRVDQSQGQRPLRLVRAG